MPDLDAAYDSAQDVPALVAEVEQLAVEVRRGRIERAAILKLLDCPPGELLDHLRHVVAEVERLRAALEAECDCDGYEPCRVCKALGHT